MNRKDQLAQTTRRITFHDGVHTAFFPSKAAGTYVYVRDLGNGQIRIRIPQTLLEQDVYPASVHMVTR